jgi:hypothetical protein
MRDTDLDTYAAAIIDVVEELACAHGYLIDLHRPRALVQRPDDIKGDPEMTIGAVYEAIDRFMRFHFPTDAFGRPMPRRRTGNPPTVVVFDDPPYRH